MAHKLRFAVAALLFVALGAADPEDAVRTTLGETVYDALKIPRGREAAADVLPSTIEALRKGTLAREPQLISSLATALNTSGNANWLSELVLSSASTSNQIDTADRNSSKFGYPGELSRLVDLLAHVSSEANDVDSRKLYARAAFLLAAQMRYPSEYAELQVLVRDDKLFENTGFEAATRQALLKEFAENSREYGEFAPHFIACVERLDGLIRGEGTQLSHEEVVAFVDSISQAWKATSRSPTRKWMIANVNWKLVCLSRAKGDTKSLETIRAKVKALREGERTEFGRRLLDQVVSLPGEPPKSSGHTVIRGPSDAKPRE